MTADSDAFLLVRNRGNGIPDPSGTLGHFVRVTQYARSTSINQLTAGGRFPQDDCAPTVLLDRLFDDGRPESILVLEQLCGTAGNGTFATGIPSLQNGARQVGYASTWIAGPCPAGFVDNPAWGGIIAPSGFAPYAAAAIGYLRIDTPGAWQAPPPPPEDDIVRVVFNSLIRGTNSTWIGDYISLRCFQSSQDVTDCLFNMQQDGVRYVVRSGNVANPRAFGAPIDAFSVAALP